jgi:hypothetical protein
VKIKKKHYRAVNASMVAARERHGQKFVEAFAALTSQPTDDPAARMIVQIIWESKDPGECLMSWYTSALKFGNRMERRSRKLALTKKKK